jgi:small subunit ribosomal protein S18
MYTFFKNTPFCVNQNFKICVSRKATLPRTPKYTISYKNVNLLRNYIGVTGKILPRQITKLTAKEHRTITKEIRRAREIGILPFVWIAE